MKTTGMVRRIDSLGRIVIPKEIRKVLKIKENQQVEINLAGDEIILNRYSELDEYNVSLNNLIDVISSIYSIDILLTNLNSFKLCSKKYKYLENQDISSYLSNILIERKDVLEKNQVNLTLNTKEKDIQTSFFIKNLIIRGDSIGLMIFLSNNIMQIDDKVFATVNNYLEKYLE